ncbi:nucleotidyltransferase domain-containing protein [Candidatus Poribacteria bacterium]|nr:nucleotidyltransferase domain-containing protein [Candidatus Poribacteria bacterium]
MDPKINEKVKNYADIVRSKFNVKMIILYGSYAKGLENVNSDIDIAVVIDEVNDNYIDLSANLFSLVREVDERIEPNLIFIKNNRSSFLENILKYGKIIYSS